MDGDTVIEEASQALRKGWRHSMRGSLYRKRGGWLAIVKPTGDECRLSRFRTERTCEDCLAAANDVLRDSADDMDYEECINV